MLNKDLYLNEKVFDQDVEQIPTRNGFGEGLVQLGDTNQQVVVLSADLNESTRCDKFATKYPDRYIECGVAEQNMAAIAAGLAVSGKVPFISSYATFSPGKNWETIRTTIVYNQANVKIAGHHSGIVTGPDGATHQATEDIASTRCWPNMQVIVPCDSIEAKKATILAGNTEGAMYLRFTRDKTPVMTTVQTPFTLGKMQQFWISDTPQVAIIGTGHLLYYGLVAAKELETEGIQTLVINAPSVKPLDEDILTTVAQKTKAFVTIEDHQVIGGLGGAIAEFTAGHYPVPIEYIGLQNTFAESGSAKELIEKYQLGKEAVKNAVKKVLKRKI